MDGPATFEEFFEANRRKLFGAFCLVTGNRQEAEEILRDPGRRSIHRSGG